ncbi:MAG TPA: head GIN domain-containing protein [Chitinophagaceae bacterium]
MRTVLVLTILSATLFSSCGFFGKRVRGNGNITTETRDVSGYNSIDVSGNIDVYVRNDSTQSVKVVTDQNLQEFLTIREEGGILRIYPRNGYNLKSSSAIKVYVSGSDFRRFEASGACDIFSEGLVSSNGSVDIDLSGSCDAKLELRSPKITADISGAGSVTLKGETKDLAVDGTGSSSFKCLELRAENVEVAITGSGSAEIFASVKLDVDVTGSGSVKYMGNAAVSQSVSGSGSVRKIQ